MNIDTAFLRDLTERFEKGPKSEETYEFEKFMEMVDEYISQQRMLGKDEEDEEEDG